MNASVTYSSTQIKIFGIKFESDGSYNPGCEVSVYDPATDSIVPNGRTVTNKQGYFEIKLDRASIKPGVYHIRYWGSGNKQRRFMPQGDWEVIEILSESSMRFDTTPPDLTKAGKLQNLIP